MRKTVTKSKIIISAAVLLAAAVAVVVLFALSPKPPIDFDKLSDKYSYVYKIMATKPIDSEICLIATLTDDSDDIYCEFQVDEIIFGECESRNITVRLPKESTSGASSESANQLLYGYFHFLSDVNSREKLIAELKVGEKYLLLLSNGNSAGENITYKNVCFLGPDNYPFSESDAQNPDDLVLMSEYLKYIAENIGFNCPGKYQYAELDEALKKYCGFSIYEMKG